MTQNSSVLRRLSMNNNQIFLEEIKQHAMIPSDICDHLETIFFEALSIKPKLIVELGVRYGDSTFVLERVARITGAKLVSVDITDCSNVSKYSGWHFIQKDDIQFAREFPEWCLNCGINPQIDVLFIDTSHYYVHTIAEISTWFPYLTYQAKVIFHDTNLKNIYYRKDGSSGFAWNNERGVIKALETYFGKSFNESIDFIEWVNGWIIKHFCICNGLIILEKGHFQLEKLL